ncbi:MAG: tetratricopeptide repeat protein [bacterium]
MGKKKNRRTSGGKRQRADRIGSLWRAIRLPLLLVALALLPRLLVLAELTDSPIFYHPVIDAQVYHERAVEIAAGDLVGYTTFWQAPLYSYFLGLIYSLFGVKILLAKLVQALLGAICCYLVFRLAERVFNRPIAWLAYLALALCGPMIFFETQLLAPVLLNFLLLLALLVLQSHHRRPARWHLLLAGLLLGLAQITHGLVIVFLPFLFLWFFSGGRGTHRGVAAGVRSCLLILAGFLPVILVTLAHNLAVDGDPVLISSNFGANFYLGNHPNYDSTTAIRPGLEWDEFIQEATVAGKLTPSQSSSYFAGKALDNIVSDLPGFVLLLGKKLHLLLAGEEIKRNLDIYYFRGYSLLLKLLLWKRYLAFPSGLFIPAALVWLGLFLFTNAERERRREKWLLLLFLFSQTAAILLFFVATRYRLVMAPVISILAAALLWRFIEAMRGKRWVLVAGVASAFLLLAVYSNLSRIQQTPRDESENDFYEGLAYSEAGQLDYALAKFKLATAGQPNYAMAEYNLALALDRAGESAQADRALTEIVRKNPKSFVANLLVGRARLDRKEYSQAERLFGQVLELNRYSVEAHINLGSLYREAGDTTQALQHLREALDLNPRAYKAYNQIGALYKESGQSQLAEANFRRSLEIYPSYASALNNLATVVSQRGLLDEAEECLETAHEVDPNDLSIILNLGALRLRQKRPQEALEFAEQVIEAAPNVPPAYHLQGVALLSLRRNSEAKAAFQQALRLDPGFQPAREQLQRLGG